MIIPDTRSLRISEFKISDLLEDEIVLAAGSALELRANLKVWEELKNSFPKKIIQLDRESNECVTVIANGESTNGVLLSDFEQLSNVLVGKKFLIDITGLRHNVWAPIVKYFKVNKIPFRVLYVEPSKYTRHPTPSSDSVFDLTTEFESMVPLPSFARLIDPDEEDLCLFVTMLGFEGSRPQRLLEPLEPKPEIIPIVGVPGFKLEYPTFAVTCNKDLLGSAPVSSELRYAKASCPFDAYETLKRIHEDNPDHYMYIAPVGTKPHALGAILFAIDNPNFTEILYDHPVGKAGRTEGKSNMNLYNFGDINA